MIPPEPTAGDGGGPIEIPQVVNRARWGVAPMPDSREQVHLLPRGTGLPAPDAHKVSGKYSSHKSVARPALWGLLGAGLITGAAGNDPSGIATYSQAGAKFGFQLAWILVLTYPLIVAIQIIGARLGLATGRGVAGNLREYYPAWFVQSTVGLLLLANTLNIGADLQGMSEAVRLLVPAVPTWVTISVFGAICVLGQTVLSHRRYIGLLKWLALIPLCYVAVLLAVSVPWRQVANGLLWPRWSVDSSFSLMVIAMLGTTISPYLLFWQSAQEVEDAKPDPERLRGNRTGAEAGRQFDRVRVDTVVGMGVSNFIGLSILVTAGTTLPAVGVHDVATAAQAAQALRPVAGGLAFVLFTLGIVGSGLLCVQVLAGSAAYALGEAVRWRVGLAGGVALARTVGPLTVVAALVAILASAASIGAIRTLVWAGVINGFVAIPVMASLMWMSGRPDLSGVLRVNGWLRVLGWLATGVMTVGGVGWVWSAL
jgi:NRAMP (natural resistance-associated macrophage protein)-like metal ion transporter